MEKRQTVSEIEEKYKNIMQKIDRRPKIEDQENVPTLANPVKAHNRLEEQDARVKKEGNPDQALKTLYDQSVSFKSELAELRQRIKGMSNNQAQFNSRFNEFEADLKNFGRKNEELQLEKIVSDPYLNFSGRN